MCNIIILKPGQMPVKTEFDNMCYNNWHSYGLVTKIDGKLDIVKKVPEVEIDPDEIYALLNRDIEFERILHVRHNTAGATSMDNCHPFDVYFDEKTGRHIVFMHNGTMYEYKSKKLNDFNALVEDPNGPSDSLNYANRILIPFLASYDEGNGTGDIEGIFGKKVLDKFWPSGNRGILISSKQETLLFGDWKRRKDTNGKEFLSSNDDYFDTCKRGPEFERREAERKKIAAQNNNKKSDNNGGRTVEPLSSFRIGYKHAFFALKDSLVNILSDWNVYDRAGATCLGFATKEELNDLYESKKDCISVMDWVFSDYAQLYKEFQELEEEKERATKMIAELKNKVAVLSEIERQKKVG